MKFKNLALLRTFLLIITLNFFFKETSAQSVDTLDQKRFKNFYIYGGAVYAGSLVALNTMWYSDYPRSKFHTFNDNSHWLQVDKAGHTYSAFTLSKLNYAFLRSGNSRFDEKAALISSLSSFAFLTSIELFDGYSREWGFSWGDMAANTIGVGLFLGQQMLFEKQILQLKYSYRESDLRELRPNTLGENSLQGAFKDYNGQTYWASFNLNGICIEIKPKWLNFAIGYGAERMFYANNEFTYNELDPYRQYYLSLDIDFEQIETNKRWLKAIFKVANCIKVPSPTIELNENGGTRFYWIYF